MVFDEPISLKCFKCGNYKILCCNKNCEKPICKNCDSIYNPKKYYIYCMKCKYNTCTKCYNILNVCNECKLSHCTKCDEGEMIENSWDCIDIFKCKNCRDITLSELYKYFCEKYDDVPSMKDIRKIILKIE